MAEVDLTDKLCICLAELEKPMLKDASQAHYDMTKRIFMESKGLMWVAKGACENVSQPDSAIFYGLARALRSENETFPLITFDLDSDTKQADSQSGINIVAIFQKSFMADGIIEDHEYSERNGIVNIKRVVDTVEANLQIAGQAQTAKLVSESQSLYQSDRHLKLAIETPGLLDSLLFIDDPEALQPLAADDVEIQICATGLNFRDVMICMGQLSDTHLGLESSGVVTKIGSNVTHLKVGQRVVAWTYGDFRNFVHNPAKMVRPIPDDMSFSDAASVPIVYCTAFYAFHHIARLQKNETVLIHAAAGGVGQAAIMLAQSYGAEVFVTVGSKEKKDLVMTKYKIPEDHIFSSRDLSFADGVKRMTGGKGVDVVLNSLAGEMLKATWKCIATFGRFIEIGKRDLVDNSRLDMRPFLRNVTFASIDLITVFLENQDLAAELLAGSMDLIRKGGVKLIAPVKTFCFLQAEEAFRYIQAGRHTGKIVLEPAPGEMVQATPRPRKEVSLDPKASYLIAGGFGGLGRSIDRWMAAHGAKYIVFISRSGGDKPQAQELLTKLKDMGVHCEAIKGDITDITSLTSGMHKALESMPAIKGVIQSTMVLEDQIFEKMSLQSFNAAVRPKVQGSWNLHTATLSQPLDFFIMLASSVGVLGNAGQGNYAAGNAYEDALAHYRVREGLPATTIDVGMMLGVGAVAEDDSGLARRNLERKGFVGIEESEFLVMMEMAMSPKTQKLCQMINGIKTRDVFEGTESEAPFWYSDPIFSHLKKMGVSRIASAIGEDGTKSISMSLKEYLSLTDASNFILDAIIHKLSRNLMMALEDFDSEKPMIAYGVDSLVAVEIRNWFSKEMKADVPVFQILQANSLAALALDVAEESTLVVAE
ncbi:Compactin diketide synthase mokB [Lachnellula suecica]|uniref:Compactin diketide synthase mokB n=1 Tax=Lachnellula suecica TaxID=602035 RepID=A0A8T9C245_9HELO|nr:Compactin diketide synthase mokB [Lachnellula suecica]